jgi:ParB-like chromosome segregation protein Spo0J
MKSNEALPFRWEDIPLIKLKKLQCRKIDQQTLARIRASIKQVGLLEPLHVSPCQGGYHKILDGEYRYDILMEMGLETAPCIIRDDMDIYTANYQVNHLTPVEETKMIKKAMEVVDGQLIAEVFGLRKISYRLNETLLSRLHPTIVKAFDTGKITKVCARELAEVVPERQLEIFAMMQNTKNFGPAFVKKQILLTPLKKQQSKRKTTPWAENKERKKSLGTNVAEMQVEHNHLAKLFREYTAALMLTVIHCREIVTNKVIEKHLKTNMPQIYTEIKAIIESELVEKKGPR